MSEYPNWPSGRIGWHLDNALLDCPFCGEEAMYCKEGNDHTKKRSVTVKCGDCMVQRKTATITKGGFDWVMEIAFKRWNQRYNDND